MPQTIRKFLWLGAVAVRVVVVAVLVFGPWTDDPAELSGWDAERFQEIAERDGAGWVDQPIEYPPGSVLVFDAIAGSDVADTNRTLVLLSAATEALTVILLWRAVGPTAAKGFLVLGLPLVPMGLLRLDMLVTALATAAAIALVTLLTGDRAGVEKAELPTSEVGAAELRAADGPSAGRGLGSSGLTAAFALLVMAGAMVKIWPSLLVAAAVSARRWRAAAAAVAACAVAGIGWLVAVGAGLDPVDQVLSLRGATGWHVESLPGSLVALFGDEEPRLELNAFRVGTLDQSLVTAGRVLALGLIGSLVLAGARNTDPTGARNTDPTGARDADPTGARRRLALVMLGSVAALVVTAPLLSPQFLLWLTPWGALLLVPGRLGQRDELDDRMEELDDRMDDPGAPNPIDSDRSVVLLLAVAVVLTGATLTAFGPSGVGDPVPAALLVIRNLALLLLPAACLLRLR